MQRWIVHVDMDAFYAAIEQRDNPELAGKPVIVGGLSRRGVVATASYEARKYGIHSAMPMSEARRCCPEGVFLPGNHVLYQEVSGQIMTVLAEFSPLIEPLSLDEAFLDISGMDYVYPDVQALACKIKAKIKQKVDLIASVGVAENKFLAKLASDLQKPDGLVIIQAGQAGTILENIPVGRIWGVGAVTNRLLQQLGISTIGQLARMDFAFLEKHCGNLAGHLHSLAQGKDERPVVAGRPPQSIGRELTFAVDLTSADEARVQLLGLAEKVGWRLRSSGYSGRTITVKIRTASFQTTTRSRTLNLSTNSDQTIYQTAWALFQQSSIRQGIRLLGITVSNLIAGEQLALFDDNGKQQVLEKAVDKLKARFGEAIITKAQLLNNGTP